METRKRAALGGEARRRRLTAAQRQAIARRGGMARAERLSAAQRRRIAALGGRRRQEGRRHLELIKDNFTRLEMVDALGRGLAP